MLREDDGWKKLYEATKVPKIIASSFYPNFYQVGYFNVTAHKEELYMELRHIVIASIVPLYFLSYSDCIYCSFIFFLFFFSKLITYLTLIFFLFSSTRHPLLTCMFSNLSQFMCFLLIVCVYILIFLIFYVHFRFIKF